MNYINIYKDNYKHTQIKIEIPYVRANPGHF